MLEITTTDELLPLVGTPAFLPAAVAYVRGLASATLPLEPSIFQAILQCIIAGDKNLIIHTPEEDVGLVARLALWTLSSLFDLPAHRLKIKARPVATSPRHIEHGPAPTPETLLRSLFMRSSSARGDVSEGSRPPSRSRNGKVKQSEYRRSASYPKELPSRKSSPHLANLSTLTDQEPLPPAPFRPHPLFHANTDSEVRPRTGTPLELPTAIVATGLEDSTISQQKALERVFAERQIILGSGPSNVTLTHERQEEGVWPLPEGFMMVYVCPWDPRERPDIYKALLDRFSMSVHVIVPQNIRQAFKSLPTMSNTSVPRPRLQSFSRSSNGSTPSPLVQVSPVSKPSHSPLMASKSLPVHQPRPQYYTQTSQTSYHHQTRPSPHPLPQGSPAPVLPKQLFPRAFLVTLQIMARQAYFSPELRLYLLDLFAATRHHSQLDGMLLTMRATEDAEAIARASRVLGHDPTGGELLDQALGSSLYEWDGVNNALRDEEAESLAQDDALSGSRSASATLARPSSRRKMSSVAGRSLGGTSMDDPRRLLYVTEADIARAMPRVVTHRLRVRDGPEAEVLASAVFGATFGREWEAEGAKESVEERPTIKDILVSILSEV